MADINEKKKKASEAADQAKVAGSTDELAKIAQAKAAAESKSSGIGTSYTPFAIQEKMETAEEAGLPEDIHLNLVRNRVIEAAGGQGWKKAGSGDFAALTESIAANKRPEWDRSEVELNQDQGYVAPDPGTPMTEKTGTYEGPVDPETGLPTQAIKGTYVEDPNTGEVVERNEASTDTAARGYEGLETGSSVGATEAGGKGPGGEGGEGGGSDSGGGAGSASGDAGCFTEGMFVRMADGTDKDIKDVKVGDKVMSFPEDSWCDDFECLVEDEVIEKHVHKNKKVLELKDGWTHVTPEHRFLIHDKDGNDVWQSVSEWQPDAHKVPGTHTVYNLSVKNNPTYVINGYKVHNMKAKGGMIHDGNRRVEVGKPVRQTYHEGEYVLTPEMVRVIGYDNLESLRARVLRARKKAARRK